MSGLRLPRLKTGVRLGEIVSQTDGLIRPWSLWVDTTRSLLVVVKRSGSTYNEMLKFTLKR